MHCLTNILFLNNSVHAGTPQEHRIYESCKQSKSRFYLKKHATFYQKIFRIELDKWLRGCSDIFSSASFFIGGILKWFRMQVWSLCLWCRFVSVSDEKSLEIAVHFINQIVTWSQTVIITTFIFFRALKNIKLHSSQY